MDIERVQRTAAPMVTGLFDTRESLTEMLKYLSWQILEDRRQTTRENLLKKFQQPVLIEETRSILQSPTYRSRKDREDKIRLITARTEAFKQSFFPRTIREWNGKKPQ